MSNNTFEQKIAEIIKNYKDQNLIESIPLQIAFLCLFIAGSVEYKPDFWYWLDFGKSHKN